MLEQVAEVLGRDDPQVDADAVVRDRARAGLARRAGLGDQRQRAERLRQRARVRRGRDQVDVLARVGPAPRAARDLDALGRPAARAARRAAPPRSGAPSTAGASASGGRPRRRRARAGCSPPPSGRSRWSVAQPLRPRPPFFSSSSDAIPSSSKSLRARFGPRPGRRVISTRPGGYFAFSFSADGIEPVSSSALSFSSIVLPIPGSSVTVPARVISATDAPDLADRLRRVPVGEHAVDDRAVELVQVGELVEVESELGVPHRRSRVRARARGLADPSDLQRGGEHRAVRRARCCPSWPRPRRSTGS